MQAYLDNAATTPIDPEVIQAMLPVFTTYFGNPSSTHSYGRKTKTLIENARKNIAKYLNAQPKEIFFTSGGTEADNTAIRRSVTDLNVMHIITSPIEHHAVLHTLQELESEKKITISYVNVDEKGNINLEHLDDILSSNKTKTLVSLMHANNEIGTLLPIKKVAELCTKHNALFHSDTVQTIGHFKIDTQALQIHFLTAAAHKFHGPKGVGFLYINSNIKIHPLITGGSQERNMRGGTENIYGIVGLSKAFQIANEQMETHQHHIRNLKNYMIEQLEYHFPKVTFNGEIGNNSLHTILNASFPPSSKAEMLLFNLDIKGVAVSGGSACSSGSSIGSHVLKGINADANRPSVRFSFSKYNTKTEIDYAIQMLKESL